MTDIKPHYGIEPTVRFLTLLAAAATGALLSRALRRYAALGVFLRFHVTDFDRLLNLFSLCHLVFLSRWFVLRQ
jgi:hypothetical protein